MTVLRIEADTLLLSDPSQSRSTVHVGVAHPTPLEEQAFGKLYVIVEIDSTERINHDIIAALQDALKSTFYTSPEFSVETAFETALQKANNRLHSFITEGVTAWIDRFNAVVAVVKNDLLLVSNVGRMHAFLFRGTRIIDIIGKQSALEEKRNPLKLFSSVLSGHLQHNDRVLACTASLLDYFSQEKLKRMVLENIPSATISTVEHALLQHPGPVSFGAILFAFSSAASSVSLPTSTTSVASPFAAAPQRSMDELIAKERTTEQLLSPSIMPNVRGFLRETIRTLQTFIRTKVLRLPPRRRAPRTLQESTRFTRPSRFGPTVRLLERIGVRVLLALVAIPRLVLGLRKRQEKIAADVRGLPTRTTGNARRIIRWLRALTPTQKALFAGALIALFILSQSIVNLSTEKKQQLRGEAVQQAIAKIEDNVSRAAAAITYDDFDGAKRLLDESSQLLSKLPNRRTSEKQRRADLDAKISGVREQTRRVKVPGISAVAELGHALNGATPTGLALTASTLLVTTNRPNALLRVSRDGEVSKIEAESPALRFAVPLDRQTILLGTSAHTIHELSLKTNAVRSVDISFPNVDRDIVSGAIFQSRLYLLDAKNNSILRTPRAGTSFGTPAQWLKDSNTTLRNGIGLSVDGSIYVATSTGELIRFTAGVKDDVSFAAIDPPLSSPTHILTSDRLPNLFVLEPAERRLIVFNKRSRQLEAQYVDQTLEAAKGFSIEDDASTVYIVTGDKVLRFEP